MYLLAMCHPAAKILLSVGLQMARSFLFLARFLDLVHSVKCKRFTGQLGFRSLQHRNNLDFVLRIEVYKEVS